MKLFVATSVVNLAFSVHFGVMVSALEVTAVSLASVLTLRRLQTPSKGWGSVAMRVLRAVRTHYLSTVSAPFLQDIQSTWADALAS